VRGAKNTVKTDSIFINDRWNLNANWSFNVGVRYEKIDSTSGSGIPKVGSDSIVPRLGVSYDVAGNGKYKVDVTYSEYSGKAIANQFGAQSPAGNPALAYGIYLGPDGEGTNFAPGYDLNNYFFFYFAAPTQTTFVDPDLKTPRTREFTVSGGMELPKGGYLKLTYENRDQKDFVETFIDRNSEVVQVQVGTVPGAFTEVQRFQNTDKPIREYEAILLQGQDRLTDSWMFGGNWTHELKNDGNFEGESGQSPGIGSTFGDFPEVFSANRNYPSGHLDNFQEDKVRLWSNYTLDFGRAGALDIGAIYRYDSPIAFSYVANSVPYSAIQLARDPGYRSIGRSQANLFFGDRGAGEFEASNVFDMALQYRIPIWRSVEPWVKFELRNMFNDESLQTYDTTVTPNFNGPLDADGLPTQYIKSPNVGKATSEASYVVPREYLISAGIRF
jgi:hypothetical protein